MNGLIDCMGFDCTTESRRSRKGGHIRRPSRTVSGAFFLGLMLFLFVILFPVGAVAQGLDLEDNKRQPFINRIEILGNRFFSDKELKKQMSTREPSFFAIFNKPRLRIDFLRRDVGLLQTFYHTNGFLEAKVELQELKYLKDNTFVDVIIAVNEGEATRVEFVEFFDGALIDQRKVRKELLLKPSAPYNPSLLSSDMYTIKRHYFEKGHLAVAVEESVAVSDRRVRIFYRLTPGPVIRIRRISVTGNKMTDNSVIMEEIQFKEGEVFQLSKAIETQRNLFETGLFKEAEINPENLDKEARTVDVNIRVRERKSAYVEAGFGVGNVLGSRVGAEWGDRNMFGTGRKLKLKTEYSFSIFDEKEFDFDHFNPRVRFYRYSGEFHQRRVFGKKVLLGINGFIEKDATIDPLVVRTVGAAVGGARRLTDFSELLLSLSHERIKRESPDIGREKSTSRVVSATLFRDARDFLLDPKSGSYRDVKFQVAGGLLGGDNDFYRVRTTYQTYLGVEGGAVLALRAQIGFADAYGASRDRGVPIENRFFTGGGNSVRGYKENSLGPKTLTAVGADTIETVLGGRVIVLTNVELRFPLPYLSRFRFSGALFADGGNVWPSLRSVEGRHFRPFVDRADVAPEDFRYSVGLGLRYSTPVGPIRLDFGIPIKREVGLDETGRFHVSLGQIF